MKNKKYKKSIIYLALVFTILWFSNTIILNAVTINKENSVKGQPEGQPEVQAEVQAEEQAENETRDLAVENTTEKYIDFGTYPQTEITDKALIEAGVTDKVLKTLDEAGISYDMFSDLKPNPSVKNVQDGVEIDYETGESKLIG